MNRIFSLFVALLAAPSITLADNRRMADEVGADEPYVRDQDLRRPPLAQRPRGNESLPPPIQAPIDDDRLNRRPPLRPEIPSDRAVTYERLTIHRPGEGPEVGHGISQAGDRTCTIRYQLESTPIQYRIRSGRNYLVSLTGRGLIECNLAVDHRRAFQPVEVPIKVWIHRGLEERIGLGERIPIEGNVPPFRVSSLGLTTVFGRYKAMSSSGAYANEQVINSDRAQVSSDEQLGFSMLLRQLGDVDPRGVAIDILRPRLPGPATRVKRIPRNLK